MESSIVEFQREECEIGKSKERRRWGERSKKKKESLMVEFQSKENERKKGGDREKEIRKKREKENVMVEFQRKVR